MTTREQREVRFSWIALIVSGLILLGLLCLMAE